MTASLILYVMSLMGHLRPPSSCIVDAVSSIFPHHHNNRPLHMYTPCIGYLGSTPPPPPPPPTVDLGLVQGCPLRTHILTEIINRSSRYNCPLHIGPTCIAILTPTFFQSAASYRRLTTWHKYVRGRVGYIGRHFVLRVPCGICHNR